MSTTYQFAQAGIGFSRISINTNGSLLREKESILKDVSHVVLSLDTLDAADYARTIGAAPEIAETIIGNLDMCAGLQGRYRFKLIVHCVIDPDDLRAAAGVLKYCVERRIRICLSPVHRNYRVEFQGEALREYRAFIDEVISMKRKGAPVSGSYAFYQNVKSLNRYECLPMLIPRILPTGDLLYPCRPRGHIAGNILGLGSWEATVQDAVDRYGRVDRCSDSCRIRCYIEPSLLMRKPLSLMREFL